MITRRAFLVSSAVAVQAQRSGPPNVVIVVADDLGRADVGYHGSEIRTPVIDRLAGDGVRLDRFYACPVCSPTRSALLTGRSPVRYGVLYDVIAPYSDYGVPVDEHLLPQTFKAAGYQTAAIGKWHLGHAYVKYLPTSRGFDSFYGHVNGAIDHFTHERDGGIDWQRNGKTVVEEGYSTDLLAEEAVRVITSRDRNKPLFLYLAFNAPHAPLQAPGRIVERYANIADPKRRVFAAMVEALDAAIGRVMTALDKEGIRQNTIVFFQSDNGGSVSQGACNTPLRGGKATTFEGGIRVPAFLNWPGRLPQGRVSKQVMSVLDVFPTVVAATGISIRTPKPLDGKNLWPALVSGKIVPREDLFFGVETQRLRRLAIIHREWKLVREIDRESEIARDSLFSLEADPNERDDLAAQHPKLVKALGDRIGKWQALHPAAGVRPAKRPPPGQSAPKRWAEAARHTE